MGADPSLRQPAAAVWAAGAGTLGLGEISVAQPGELLLEGLGRALGAFEPLQRGLEGAAPEQMDLAAAEGTVGSADSKRKWPEMMQVHYDEPSRVSEQPLALMRRFEFRGELWRRQ